MIFFFLHTILRVTFTGFYAPAFLLYAVGAAAGLFYIAALLRRFLSGRKRMEDVAKDMGFNYDPEQNIFYSDMNAWQRRFGYCRLYDDAAAPMGMIIDCEPIRFEYEGKKWLIEFWKGQYGMTTGAEIGVYTTKETENLYSSLLNTGSEISVPGFFEGVFYGDTNGEDHLQLSLTLYKDGRTLFTRAARHWGLTGFVLGEFSQPEELSARVCVTLKTSEMYDVFLSALKNAGYRAEQYREDPADNTVAILFEKPCSSQPFTREPFLENLAQASNKMLCGAYNDITGDFKSAPEKLAFIRKENPRLYRAILKSNTFKGRFSAGTKLRDSQGRKIGNDQTKTD